MRMDARLVMLGPATLLAFAGLAACGSNSPKTTPTRVTAEQFATRPAAAVPDANGTQSDSPVAQSSTTATPPTLPATDARPSGSATTQSGTPGPSDTLPIRSFVGTPEQSVEPVAAAADPIVLESVIGQINGRPVFVSEILDPLDGKLRVLADRNRNNHAAFIKAAQLEIFGVLKGKIHDELILAEARASLTPEQQQGLFYFLGQVQKNMVSQQSGSRLQADEASREGTGRTLQQEARDKLQQSLIENEINQKIMSRVNIPWRLVRQEYERDPDRFSPPGVAKLRLITVPLADAERVRAAEAAIADHPFADAAAMEFNGFARETGGLQQREFRGEYSKATLFAPALNIAAQSLTPGQTAGPIRWDNSLAWVHLESIEQPPARSLYDAQLELDMELRDRKRKAESEVYFGRLLGRGSFTQIEIMIAKVEEVAIERYLPAASQ